MIKPAAVRKLITAANPHLARDPDKLHVFLDSGQVAARGTRNLSWEYRYTLNIIIEDYPHSANRIILPLLAWLRTQQPELFENPQRHDDIIRFDAELLNEDTIDLSLQVDLTERVIVSTTENGHLTATHAAEPPLQSFLPQEVNVDVYDQHTGQQLGSYTFPAWDPQF